MKKILLFGAQGMLGMDLFETLSNANFEVIPYSKFNLDLRETQKIMPLIEKISPSIVINAAAFTNTEKAEDKNFQEEVLKINCYAPSEMAKACQKIKAYFLHFSTDFVFDGKNKKFFPENHQKNPLNFYGLSKSKGEDLVQKNCSNYGIFRTSWLFGENGTNFISKILRLFRNKKEIAVVDDIFIQATFTKDLAKNIKNLISQENIPQGVFHLSNKGVFSLLEIAQMAFKNQNYPLKALKPISYQNFASQINRPLHAILKNTKLKPLRPLKEALGEYLISNFPIFK